jgi:hypothetical protein
MRRLLALAFVLAGCGGSAHRTTTENRTDVPRGPAPDAIFLGAGQRLALADCRNTSGAFDGAACAGRDKAMVAERAAVIGSDGVRYRLTGEVADECDASGETLLMTIEREDGAAIEVAPTFAMTPPDADVQLVTYDASFSPTTPPDVAKDVLEKLAAMATTSVAEREDDATVSVRTSELRVLENIEVDLDGDGVRDRLISADLPNADDEPGYRWAGLAFVPGGRADATRIVWESDLEHMIVDATLDLDGDGRREIVFRAEYYEGVGVGIARIVNGEIDLAAVYGCEA